MSAVNIVHLYPKEMNIYGDNGNILVLQNRLRWRNIDVTLHKVGVGDPLPKQTHLIMGGGGQDKGQSIIADDLQIKAKQLHALAQSGVPMLMICGMYQMFGHYFKTAEGQKIPGIGVLDVHTIAGQGRLIGNITEQTSDWGDLVGYENHSGLTYIGDKAKPLGTTALGQGNNGKDCTEGAVQYSVYGTYLHGPMLAKSPLFADYLLSKALEAAGLSTNLAFLDDSLEITAAKTAQTRPR